MSEPMLVQRKDKSGVRLIRTGMADQIVLNDISSAIDSHDLTIAELRAALDEHDRLKGRSPSQAVTPVTDAEIDRVMQMASAFASAFSSNYGSDEDEANVKYYRAALRAEVVRLCSGLVAPVENANDRFEREATAFFRATGMLAPGKSVPAALASDEYEAERQRRWAQWIADSKRAASPDAEASR